MQRVLVVFTSGASTPAAEVRQEIPARGGRVLHSYGPAVLVFEGDAELVRSIGERPGVLGVHTGPVEDDLPHLDETGRIGINAWNATLSRSFHEAKRKRKGEGLPWDTDENDNED